MSEAATRMQLLFEAIDEARLKERERCARIAERQAEFVAGGSHEKLCHRIASLIREDGA